jgi:hypothetical protein
MCVSTKRERGREVAYVSAYEHVFACVLCSSCLWHRLSVIVCVCACRGGGGRCRVHSSRDPVQSHAQARQPSALVRSPHPCNRTSSPSSVHVRPSAHTHTYTHTHTHTCICTHMLLGSHHPTRCPCTCMRVAHGPYPTCTHMRLPYMHARTHTYRQTYIHIPLLVFCRHKQGVSAYRHARVHTWVGQDRHDCGGVWRLLRVHDLCRVVC